MIPHDSVSWWQQCFPRWKCSEWWMKFDFAVFSSAIYSFLFWEMLATYGYQLTCRSTIFRNLRISAKMIAVFESVNVLFLSHKNREEKSFKPSFCAASQWQHCCEKEGISKSRDFAYMFSFLLNLIFQRKHKKNDLRFSFAASRCCLFVKINFFVPCVCLHNKNQKVFSRKRKKNWKRDSSLVSHSGSASKKLCTRQTSPRRFVLCLLRWLACTIHMVVIFPKSRKWKRQREKNVPSSPLANSFCKLLAFFFVQIANCCVSSTRVRPRDKARATDVLCFILSRQLASSLDF